MQSKRDTGGHSHATNSQYCVRQIHYWHKVNWSPPPKEPNSFFLCTSEHHTLAFPLACPSTRPTWFREGRCCWVPSCPGAARTREWWPGRWALERVRGSGSGDSWASSCWGSWQKNDDGTVNGCEEEGEVVSVLTGCDDLKGLKQKRKSNHKCVLMILFSLGFSGHLEKSQTLQQN